MSAFYIWLLIQIGFGLLVTIICSIRISFDLDCNSQYHRKPINSIFILSIGSVYFYIFNQMSSINKTGKIILSILWSILFILFEILMFLLAIIITGFYLFWKLFYIIFRNKGEKDDKS